MTEIEKMAEIIATAIIGDTVDNEDTQSSIPLATALYKQGYRKQSDTITFYKDPNIKDWAESEYAWCERPCDSNMSMRAIDKKGSIVGYASEHYWTWCDVKEVKKVSAIEFMRHFASKQGETVDELMALKEQNEALKKQLENSAQLIKDYKHFIEYDIERLYYIIETAEREETENENNMSVWSVGYDTDYDSYEQMTALEERIGNQVLSRLVAELKKGVKLRKIGTAEAEARLKELSKEN